MIYIVLHQWDHEGSEVAAVHTDEEAAVKIAKDLSKRATCMESFNVQGWEVGEDEPTVDLYNLHW
jgi:hypothetical protein